MTNVSVSAGPANRSPLSAHNQAQAIENLLGCLESQLRDELFFANEITDYERMELHLAHLSYLKVGMKQLRTALQAVAR